MVESEFSKADEKANRRNSRNKKFYRDSSEKTDRMRLAKVFDNRRERKQTKRFLNKLY